MRIAAIGALIGAGLVLAWLAMTGASSDAFAQQPGQFQSAPAGELIALSIPAEGRQQLVIIDPKQRVLSVYHIDMASGEIALRSVRNIQWDLQLSEYNAEDPLPCEIRALLEQRR